MKTNRMIWKSNAIFFLNSNFSVQIEARFPPPRQPWGSCHPCAVVRGMGSWQGSLFDRKCPVIKLLWGIVHVLFDLKFEPLQRLDHYDFEGIGAIASSITLCLWSLYGRVDWVSRQCKTSLVGFSSNFFSAICPPPSILPPFEARVLWFQFSNFCFSSFLGPLFRFSIFQILGHQIRFSNLRLRSVPDDAALRRQAAPPTAHRRLQATAVCFLCQISILENEVITYTPMIEDRGFTFQLFFSFQFFNSVVFSDRIFKYCKFNPNIHNKKRKE